MLFLFSDHLQSARQQEAVMKTRAIKKVKTTLQKRHDKRQIWISMTPEMSNVYVDGDGNVEFNGYVLEEIKPEVRQQASTTGISEEALARIIENFSEIKKILFKKP